MSGLGDYEEVLGSLTQYFERKGFEVVKKDELNIVVSQGINAVAIIVEMHPESAKSLGSLEYEVTMAVQVFFESTSTTERSFVVRVINDFNYFFEHFEAFESSPLGGNNDVK